ncbi:hypothetical protein BJ508DRAFT_311019 [Ascobolus immersus RN42]|uniref:Uncharacterized protein n=1 Tax=Ascobolus immersus RN42 TaxID=1160509 RepID=A0A3N4HRQ8_ASCIM|nr:hypothetical protein BJ508DRAFT_311019 [Ascobolus immersus RN42]
MPFQSLPNEMRLAIADQITNWTDHSAFRHMDSINFALLSGSKDVKKLQLSTDSILSPRQVWRLTWMMHLNVCFLKLCEMLALPAVSPSSFERICGMCNGQLYDWDRIENLAVGWDDYCAFADLRRAATQAYRTIERMRNYEHKRDPRVQQEIEERLAQFEKATQAVTWSGISYDDEYLDYRLTDIYDEVQKYLGNSLIYGGRLPRGLQDWLYEKAISEGLAKWEKTGKGTDIYKDSLSELDDLITSLSDITSDYNQIFAK